MVRDRAVLAGWSATGLSGDAYTRRLAAMESAREHAVVLDEGLYADAEAERLAG